MRKKSYFKSLLLVLILAVSTVIVAPATTVQAAETDASKVKEVGTRGHKWSWKTWSKGKTKYFQITDTYTRYYSDNSVWKFKKFKKYRYTGSVKVNDKDDGQVTWKGSKKLLKKSSKTWNSKKGESSFDPRKKTQDSSGSGGSSGNSGNSGGSSNSSGNSGGSTSGDTTYAYDQAEYDYLAARGAFGRSVINYASDAGVQTTKGHFVWMLYNMYGSKLSGNNTASAADLLTTSPYYDAMVWSLKLGITSTYIASDGKAYFGRDDATTPRWEADVLSALAIKIDGQGMTWDVPSTTSTVRADSVDRIYKFTTASWANYDPSSPDFGKRK